MRTALSIMLVALAIPAHAHLLPRSLHHRASRTFHRAPLCWIVVSRSADPGEPDIVDKGACPQWRQYFRAVE